MKQKIAIIINTLATGGAEKTAGLLMNQLHADWEIHLLMFDTRNIEFPIPDDVKIYQIGRPTSAEAKPIQVLKLPWQALQIKKYLQLHGIRLVFSILNRPNFIAGYLKLFGFKGKTIINERSNASYYYTNKTLGGRLGRFLVKRLYQRADCIITNSIFSKNDLQETFGLKNNIITISNGIPYQAIQQRLALAELPFDKKPGEFIFCHVGRFHEDKNQLLLLTAFAKMKEKQSRLLLVGKDIPKQFKQKVAELGLEERVILKDLQTDIWPFYKISDAFVLSSNVEGYPNVLLEALAAGLPVISTDCKWGPREILAPDTQYPANGIESIEWAEYGILIRCGDSQNMADAMDKLIVDSEKYTTYKQKTSSMEQLFSEEMAIHLFKTTISSFHTI